MTVFSISAQQDVRVRRRDHDQGSDLQYICALIYLVSISKRDDNDVQIINCAIKI